MKCKKSKAVQFFEEHKKEIENVKKHGEPIAKAYAYAIERLAKMEMSKQNEKNKIEDSRPKEPRSS